MNRRARWGVVSPRPGENARRKCKTRFLGGRIPFRKMTAIASIMIRPRATMRRILDAGRDRMVIPLVLLATLSAILGDLDRSSLDAMRKLPVNFGLLAVGICVGVSAFFLLLFYVFTWIAYGMGRLLEGTATPREVRSAMAWGLAPNIWAILYRLPAVLLSPGAMESRLGVNEKRLVFNPDLMGMGCIGSVIFSALELTTLVWYCVVASKTVGEANRFSAGRGFGTLVLTGISPAIIMIAAFL